MNLMVRWDKMGPEFSYYVWYAKNPKGPWIRANDMRLTDDSLAILQGLSPSVYTGTSYNEYIIEGLDEQTKYSVHVTCDDRYDAWWYSYDGPEDLAGGLSTPSTRPSPDGGNIIGFQFRIL